MSAGIKINNYVPSSLAKFQCDLSGRCCGGWEIGMDDCSYERLKSAMTGKNDLKRFEDNVKLCEPEEGKAKYYAVIDLSDERCGLLEDSGLCSIHKDYGFEALPDICKTFPRLVYATPFGKELSVTFACPTAAKLLAQKEKIRKVKNPENFVLSNGNQYYGLITREIFERTDIKKFYFELEDHFIKILQHDEFSLDERLVLLGLSLKRLLKFDKPEHENILSVFRLNHEIMSGSFFKSEVKKIIPAISQQVFLLKEFINLRLDNVPDLHVKALLEEVAKNFGFDKDDSQFKLCVDRYIDYYHEYYYPVRESVEYVFENYLVYFLYRKPFANHDPEDAYFLTIYFYSLIRLVAIGLAIEEQRSVDVAVKAVWIIEKAVGHSYTFYLTVLEHLSKHSLTSVSHGITLFLMPEKEEIKCRQNELDKAFEAIRNS
ncbi:MAG: flagellin lysine-N-methylase [Spirochaetota bacterium]|nr:flagellin lysine-N-methylase [Spirochaetota bacterium]